MADEVRSMEQSLTRRDEPHPKVARREAVPAPPSPALKGQAMEDDQLLRQRNEIVFHHVGDPVAVIDIHDFRITDANRAFLEKYNLKEEDLGKIHCYEITHRQDKPCSLPHSPCPLKETLDTGLPSSKEHIHFGPGGEMMFVEVATYPLFNENKELISAVHITRDITERRKAGRAFEELESKRALESELLSERNKLQQILDSLPDGILVVDGNNRFEWANARFKEITGIDPETLGINGVIPDHFYAGPVGTEEPDPKSPMAKVRETGQPVQFIHFESGDETGQRYFRIIITPFFNKEGKLNRIVETVRPITEIVLQRRQIDESELRFRQFIENARDMITIKDLEGRYLVINEPAAALFRKVPMDFIGRKDHEILPEKVADLLVQRDKEMLERKGYLESKASLAINGVIRYLDIVHFPLFNYKRDITGVCSISRDATEKNKLEKMLIQSEKMAAVGKLAASVAHEINNPLTGVLSFAEELKMDAMEQDPDNPAIRDYDVIIQEAIRCREIVSQVLDYARLERPRRRLMHINRVIERSLDLVRKQAKFHDIKFENHLDEKLPEVQFDPGQMQQVFLNLIINAAEAMNGVGKIMLSSRLSHDGRLVEGIVADNGPGIPLDIIDSIFEPFFSTKGSRGTGQGLSVVKAVIEQQGGMIEVDSRVGQGATFKVSIPVTRNERQE